jgi:hypothetical protein
MPYGFSPYGFGPYGNPVGGTTFSVAGAVAISNRQVQVTFTVQPFAVSGFGTRDALNPALWTVTNQATGAVIPVGAVRVSGTDTVELWLTTPLAGYATGYQVAASPLLLSAGGTPILPPITASFSGITGVNAVPDSRPQRPRAVDLKAAPAGNGSDGTTLVIKGGDYDVESGRALMRKCINRRLTTRKGAFFHLPNYGVEQIQPKMLYAVSNLRALKSDIENQVQQEPDVLSASATLISDPANNILTVTITATSADDPAPLTTTLNLQVGAG